MGERKLSGGGVNWQGAFKKKLKTKWRKTKCKVQWISESA
jgi:hypothetical protein